jgi:hypothetical protein
MTWYPEPVSPRPVLASLIHQRLADTQADRFDHYRVVAKLAESLSVACCRSVLVETFLDRGSGRGRESGAHGGTYRSDITAVHY